MKHSTLTLTGFFALFLAIPAGRVADLQWAPDKPDVIAFKPVTAKYVRLTLISAGIQPCLDEVEILAPNGKDNLALASAGAKATAKSCLTGHAIHQIAHLNDGLYGNEHSWIATDAGYVGDACGRFEEAINAGKPPTDIDLRRTQGVRP